LAKVRLADAKARGFPSNILAGAGIGGNTTGLAGKEKAPQLMVFYAKKTSIYRCAK
jgi:hypothetical protein